MRMKISFKVLPFLGMVVLFLSLGITQVYASCEDGELEYGDGCEASFSEGDDPHVYSFFGEEGDIATLTLEWEDDATGSVTVIGPIEDSDQEEFDLLEGDEGSSGEVQLEELELPSDGLYAILVSFDADADYVFALEGESGGGGSNVISTSTGGMDIECDDGTVVQNGVQLIITMRRDFDYTVTAVGVDGYDPAIAVGTPEEPGSVCSDDSRDAEDFEADLPTTGSVDSSDTSAQVVFSHSIDEFALISIVTGSPDGDAGDFILIVEGLAITSGDGVGDPYYVLLTPNMTTASVPLTIYMLASERTLDPFISWVTDFENFEYFADNDGNPIYCDDGGNASSCWGESATLDGSSISTSQGDVDGASLDSMLSVDLSGFEGEDPFYMNFVLGSYNQSSTGNYVAAFHFGVDG
jgi:hypothetical protein